MTRDDSALQPAIEQCAAVLTSAGFPKMPARVLVTLLAADRGGLTAAELGDQLKVSAAAISGAVRYLELVGVVHRVSQPGSRRVRWELYDDSWYTALSTQNSVYARTADSAERIAQAIGDPDAVASRRITDMVQFFRFLDRRMPELMREWDAERARSARRWRGGDPATRGRAGGRRG